MVKEVYSEDTINEDDALELSKLREIAKIGSIYHKTGQKFHRNENLTHVVHASLHGLEFVVALAVEVFHHVHHHVNANLQEQDDSVPVLPEERNPIFFVYPFCMLVCVLFAVLWLFTRILEERPEIAFVGCFLSAVLLLAAGVMEMRHADMYIDLTEISDEELLTHPVFVHNFVMCILSIFCMTIFLIQAWTIFDYWHWIRKQRSISDDSDDFEASGSSESTDVIRASQSEERVDKYGKKRRGEPGEMNPIPSLNEFPSLTSIRDDKSAEAESVILYCCFVDCYNYVRQKYRTRQGIHEFQVVHVM